MFCAAMTNSLAQVRSVSRVTTSFTRCPAGTLTSAGSKPFSVTRIAMAPGATADWFEGAAHPLAASNATGSHHSFFNMNRTPFGWARSRDLLHASLLLAPELRVTPVRVYDRN